MEDLREMNDLLVRLGEKTDKIDEKIQFLVLRLWQWGVGRIFDDAVRKSVANYYVARVPFQFFISPSSATKNYHPRWHNEPGGIVRHLIESCIIVEALFNSFGFLDRNKKILPEARDIWDIVIAATLISDTQKNGLPWSEKTDRRHGEIAADIWRVVAIGCEVSHDFIEKITEAATWHYGRFTPSEIPQELHELPVYVQIVHLADSVSSSRLLESVFVPQKRIVPPPKSE